MGATFGRQLCTRPERETTEMTSSGSLQSRPPTLGPVAPPAPRDLDGREELSSTGTYICRKDSETLIDSQGLDPF